MTSNTDVTPDADHLTPVAKSRHFALVYVSLLVAMLLASLDQIIFSAALPTIVGELQGLEQMLWVPTAYILAATIVMPVYGKVGDLIGRRLLFLGALALFIGGSVLGGLADAMPTLITARAIQGLGGGGLIILAQAIVADLVPLRERSTYMSAIGGIAVVSAVAGPLIGGWLTEGIGWRWAFWINVPLGLLAMVAAWRFLPRTRRPARFTFDTAGFVALSVAVTAVVVITATGGRTHDWGSLQILGLSALAVVALGAFIAVERRAANPILPLSLFRSRNFVVATVIGLALTVAMFGVMGYFPTYLQMARGYDATEAGLLIIPLVIGLMLTIMPTGVLVSRTGRYKWMLFTSPALTAVALLLLSTLTVSTPTWLATIYLFLLGAGVGFGAQNVVLVAQSAFPVREVGTATAANNFFREIGASFGAAAVGAFFTGRLTAELRNRLPGDAGTEEVSSLTPQLVRTFAGPARDAVTVSYNEALTPIFLLVVPLMIAMALLAFLIRETPLTSDEGIEVGVLWTPSDEVSGDPEGRRVPSA
ncbi:MAG TPA: DHA2 family efflux MFS transporter permease subunit [Thermomicrobiales bacterium]|nr:DHA2 family efflux MFS transporter permease subunit [Thermomicrobiales bacterium]